MILEEFVNQSGNNFRFPPQIGSRALGGSNDERQVFALDDLGRSMFLDQIQVVSAFAPSVKKD